MLLKEEYNLTISIDIHLWLHTCVFIRLLDEFHKKKFYMLFLHLPQLIKYYFAQELYYNIYSFNFFIYTQKIFQSFTSFSENWIETDLESSIWTSIIYNLGLISFLIGKTEKLYLKFIMIRWKKENVRNKDRITGLFYLEKNIYILILSFIFFTEYNFYVITLTSVLLGHREI